MEVKKHQEDQLANLATFLGEIKQPFTNAQTDQITRAMELLKILPAAQDAVLEYYEKFFEYAISTYLKQLKAQSSLIKSSTLLQCPEPSIISPELIENVTNIRDVLLMQVEENHLVWAPIVFYWSFKLSHRVSKYYAKYKFAKISLSDMLRFWSRCSVAYILVDIMTKIIAKMVKAEGEHSVDFMIKTMLGYKSSSFEWVLVQIGGNFPSLVIKNMLLCGIKEMSAIKQFKNTEKLKSFIKILDLLSIAYFSVIKDVMFKLFELSIVDEHQKMTVENVTTVPFVMRTVMCSSILLKPMLYENLMQITPEMLIKLIPLYPEWQKYFDEQSSLLDILIKVLLNADCGIKQIFKLIFQLIECEDPKYEVLKTGAQSLLVELQHSLRTNRTTPPIVKALVTNLHVIKPYLLSSNINVAQPAAMLINCIGIKDKECLLPFIATMLIESENSTQQETLVEILSFGLNMIQFDGGLAHALVKSDISLFNVWNNINTLLVLESNPQEGISLHGASLAVVSHLDKICRSMIECCHHGNMKSAHLLSSILYKISTKLYTKEISVPKVLYCVKAAVLYFFTCLYKENDEMFKLKACLRMNKFINTVSFQYPMARNATMKYILDGVLREPFSKLFVMPNNQCNDYIIQSLENTSLMGSFFQQEFNSTFGKEISVKFDKDELNPKYKTPVFDAKRVHFNKLRLISFLHSCYSSDEANLSKPILDTVVSLALLVVQFVSPDVMHNGFVWPDEDFTKLTTEKYVHIYHKITTNPILWTILGILAGHRPALCYCLVLLRAVCICLINHWGKIDHSKGKSKDNQQILDDTVKLLNTMSLGQLLPKPFNVLGVIVPELTPHQILVLLRDCVWTYMRDHIPTPALFSSNNIGGMWRDTLTKSVPKQYSEPLRLTLMENISEFGDLYARLFTYNEEQSDDD